MFYCIQYFNKTQITIKISTMNKTEIERRSLAEQLYDTIKRMILNGEIKGGEKVPEEMLAEQFQVSRTPIREALRRLEEYGLVNIVPRSYAQVITLNNSEMEDIIEVRLCLEKLSVELFSMIAKKEDIAILKKMTAKCLRFLNNNNIPEAFEMDSLFHLEIAKRCGNNSLYEILERFDSKIQLVRLLHCKTIETVKQSLEYHHNLMNAFENHNKIKAVEIIQKHIGA